MLERRGRGGSELSAGPLANGTANPVDVPFTRCSARWLRSASGLRGEAATRTPLRAASRPQIQVASRTSRLPCTSEAGDFGTAKMKVRWTNPKSLAHSARTRKV
eukprot:scaffold117835_cov66-Phaeocystis_antarctica.AAC.7